MFLKALMLLLGMSQILWIESLNLFLILIGFCLSVTSFFLYQTSRLKSFLWISIFLVGVVYSSFVTHLEQGSKLTDSLESSIGFTAYVDNLPKYKNHSNQFSLTIIDGDLNTPIQRILATQYLEKASREIVSGDRVLVNAKVKPADNFDNPGSYDFKKWMFRNNYDAVASIKSIKVLPEVCNKFSCNINRIRQKISFFIDNVIVDPKARGIIKALSIGDKSDIKDDVADVFATTGTAHLIVISGLHIGMVALLGILLGSVVFWCFPSQKFKRINYQAVFALSFAFLYALLAGFSIPTIRALIMLAVFFISVLYKTNLSRWSAWSISLVIVLVSDPLSVLDNGFWLSFVAVAFILFAFEGRKSETNKIKTISKAQAYVFIGLMPLVLLHFGQINLLAPIINLVIIPFASFILVPIVLLAMLFQFISGLVSAEIYFFAEIFTLKTIKFLEFFSNNKSSFLQKSINPSSFWYVYILAILLLAPKLIRWKWMVLPLFLLFLNKPKKHLENDEFIIQTFDVGQGLSLFVQTKNHSLIYDLGFISKTGFNTAKSVVIPYLKKLQVNSVDKIIFSHEDSDHIGGRDFFIQHIKTNKVYTTKKHEKYKQCTAPLSWNWDGVDFEVLSPYNLTPYLQNNSSCVIKIKSRYGSVLLTGDIEEAVEYRLVNQHKENIDVEVLFVPHHGSKTSSSKSFIEAVSPAYAINSSGFANQFNHPHPNIVNRYEKYGIKFIDTKHSGKVELSVNDEGINISEYKSSKIHLWNN